MKVAPIVVFALLASATWAQTPTASRGILTGTIVDASGAVVVGAKVTLKGPAPRKLAVTDKHGQFLFPDLPLGFYSLRVEKKFFKPADIKGIGVETAKSYDVRIGLVAGKAGEVVEIIDRAIAVDTTSSATHNCITDVDMQSMPMDRTVGAAITSAGRCP